MASKVAVIGSGSVGTALGRSLLRAGRTVKYGTRDASSAKVQELLKQQPGSLADGVHESVAWADVVILAVPGATDDAGIQKVATSLGPGVKGKVLVDATNPLTAWPGLEVRHGQVKSAGEVLAEALPETSVFKAFNTIGVEHLDHGDGSLVTGQKLTMLLAGPQDKRDIAERVVADVGFEPLYVGPIRYARNLEAIAELWIHLGVQGAGFTSVDLGRNFHFQTIKKP